VKNLRNYFDTIISSNNKTIDFLETINRLTLSKEKGSTIIHTYGTIENAIEIASRNKMEFQIKYK
jgi:hypothetical protein